MFHIHCCSENSLCQSERPLPDNFSSVIYNENPIALNVCISLLKDNN